MADRICDPHVAAVRFRQQLEIYAQLCGIRSDSPQGLTAFEELSASEFFLALRTPLCEKRYSRASAPLDSQ
jgi:hypothetical protein